MVIVNDSCYSKIVIPKLTLIYNVIILLRSSLKNDRACLDPPGYKATCYYQQANVAEL